MFKRLLGSKTFWAGLAGIATSAGAYFAGELSLTTFISTSFTALLAIFLRDGIAKNGG